MSALGSVGDRLFHGCFRIIQTARESWQRFQIGRIKVRANNGIDLSMNTALNARNKVLIAATLMNEDHQKILFKSDDERGKL